MLKPSLEDLIKSAIRSILKNKGRTILTSLGIIIGVTSVILLTSIGTGLQYYINQQFDKLGSNLIYVSPGQVFNSRGGFNNSEGGGLNTISFDQKDYRNLRRTLTTSVVVPANQISTDIKYGNKSDKYSLVGTTPEWSTTRNMVPKSENGRWFTQEEYDKNSKVAVIGYQIWEDLFPHKNPLGKKIIVNNKTFEVIGVVDKQGSTFGGPNLDSYVYIPLTTFDNLTGKNIIPSFSIKAPSKDEIAVTKSSVEKILGARYKKDEFSVFDSAQLLSSINGIISTLTIGLTGIAAISLVVGGIGIMNIMLVTVSERTREIGLRKAIGAYPRAILLQFLIEAVILSGIGGTMGIILGWLGTLAINNFFPARVTPTSILIAFGVSFAVGVIFGVAPARKASKLSPIEALRYE